MFKEAIQRAYGLLQLDRKIVGVKLLKNEEQYLESDAKSLVNPMSYCVAVKSASFGHRIKLNKFTSDCGGSTRCLGLEHPNESFMDGSSLESLGLFENQTVAKSAAEATSNVLEDVYGILVQPVECYSEEYRPDIILIISNPRELMRVIQGYSYHHGISKSFSLSGNQGMCVEATAYPLLNNTINISMLCSGTRFLASWKEYEAVLGIPFGLFESVIDGVYRTVNAVEKDKRKNQIETYFKEQKLECMDMAYGTTYYEDYEKEKRRIRESRES